MTIKGRDLDDDEFVLAADDDVAATPDRSPDRLIPVQVSLEGRHVIS